MNKAVFLDRDGTINVEKGYLYKISDFEFIPGAVEGISLLNEKGYKVFIVTNQAGVARGFYTEEDVLILHKWLKDELMKRNANVERIYYCPHHIHGLGPYKTGCNCRKPAAGMFMNALKEYNVDPVLSFTIGDKESDLIAGKAAGTKTILVETGYGKDFIRTPFADYIASNLLFAVEYIIP
ncbi:MAG: D-glycero-beta-D-manno-heptose 1,7-bisphosphate 7-phosphatase [Clostridiales bacterium]|jgi:D-glycero-D-manno-heptose 1,7-bisphosphate phosphatase|nr:D-glycero-beta-D-manno-heptose 1,7-bisphosphate 7-phosphatase [Eubacteriales bacterium]MDH7566499.1 D-glycero-beta-D-manno-heptose 1,7-bisphosphate 7-phosphatase [Clostridiales bacterium]